MTIEEIIGKIETWRGMCRQMRKTAEDEYWRAFRDGQYNAHSETLRLLRAELLQQETPASRDALGNAVCTGDGDPFSKSRKKPDLDDLAEAIRRT